MNIDIAAINKRIEQLISQNKRSERVITYMSIGIFLLGITLLIIEVLSGEIILIGFTILINVFLYWPVKAILKIRKENIVLSATATVLETCPTEKAIVELEKLWAFIRERK